MDVIELVVDMLLIAGAFMNICALAYLIGIAYVAPLAFGSVVRDEFLLVAFSMIVMASTLLAWFFFRRNDRLVALLFMYAWWIGGIWFINSLIRASFD
jgi:hypothetical protein